MRMNSFVTGMAAGATVAALASAALGMTMTNPKAKRVIRRSANRAMSKMNETAHNITDLMD